MAKLKTMDFEVQLMHGKVLVEVDPNGNMSLFVPRTPVRIDAADAENLARVFGGAGKESRRRLKLVEEDNSPEAIRLRVIREQTQAWVQSEEGQRRIAESLRIAQEATDKLKEARRIRPEDWHQVIGASGDTAD